MEDPSVNIAFAAAAVVSGLKAQSASDNHHKHCQAFTHSTNTLLFKHPPLENILGALRKERALFQRFFFLRGLSYP